MLNGLQPHEKVAINAMV